MSEGQESRRLEYQKGRRPRDINDRITGFQETGRTERQEARRLGGQKDRRAGD